MHVLDHEVTVFAWNSKPTHHAWCTLLTLLHAWSQSASVPFLEGDLTRNQL